MRGVLIFVRYYMQCGIMGAVVFFVTTTTTADANPSAMTREEMFTDEIYLVQVSLIYLWFCQIHSIRTQFNKIHNWRRFNAKMFHVLYSTKSVHTGMSNRAPKQIDSVGLVTSHSCPVYTFKVTGCTIDLRESGRKAARVRNVIQEMV